MPVSWVVVGPRVGVIGAQWGSNVSVSVVHSHILGCRGSRIGVIGSLGVFQYRVSVFVVHSQISG